MKSQRVKFTLLFPLLVPVIGLAAGPDSDWRQEEPASWEEAYPSSATDRQTPSRRSGESLSSQVEERLEQESSERHREAQQRRESAEHSSLCSDNARNPLDAQQQSTGANTAGDCAQPDLRFSFGDRD